MWKASKSFSAKAHFSWLASAPVLPCLLKLVLKKALKVAKALKALKALKAAKVAKAAQNKFLAA